jgi:hypothetical protein
MGKCDSEKATVAESPPAERTLRERLFARITLPSGRTATLREAVSNAANAEARGAVAGVSTTYGLDVPREYPGPGTIDHGLWEWPDDAKAQARFRSLVESVAEGDNPLVLRDHGQSGDGEYAVLGTENPGSFFSLYTWREGNLTFEVYGSDEQTTTNILEFWRCLDY